jgi:hypothetical protein
MILDYHDRNQGTIEIFFVEPLFPSWTFFYHCNEVDFIIYSFFKVVMGYIHHWVLQKDYHI